MAYLDSWKSKLNKQGGNIANSLKNTAKQSVLASFEDSPAYKLITINGVSTGVRIEKGKLSNEMTLLFKPGTVVDIGSLCVIDTVNWLVMDSQKDEIYPKAKISLCNETFKWKDQVGTVFLYPCVATNLRYITREIDSNRNNISTLEGGLYIYSQQNSTTLTLKPRQRFIFGSQVYHISGIDDITFTDSNNVGAIQFTLMLTEKNDEKDDFVNQIADNSHLNATPSTGSGDVGW
jgi:hypothetical protein